MRSPLLLAGISILLWSTLAAMATRLVEVPPFFLLALTLGIGSLPSLSAYREWWQAPRVLLFGTAGIFGYHLLLFLALRKAPPIEANLINYLWPILIVLFSPVFLRGFSLTSRHLLGSAIAFLGATLVVTGGSLEFRAEYATGYALAFGAAVVWAGYSVLTKRLPPFSTRMVGGFCFFSAILAFIFHRGLENGAPNLSASELGLIALLGVGPLGAAFYAWDAALKAGDPRMIGTLSYFTPLLSTAFLAGTSERATFTPRMGLSLGLIIGGALLSAWKRK